ncbi:hypothetical protein LEP1GSC073_1033 [Leptospira noguchii str. Cascata]|nr:hypothetical protein LEP1GSC073_1033 [Leptospira noguchii str. Cascata]
MRVDSKILFNCRVGYDDFCGNYHILLKDSKMIHFKVLGGILKSWFVLVLKCSSSHKISAAGQIFLVLF